jgi:hypothetical protein
MGVPGLLKQSSTLESSLHSFRLLTSCLILAATLATTLRLRLQDELPHILIIRHITVDGLADLLCGFLAVSLDPFFVPLFFCFDLSSLFVSMLSVV